MSQDPLIKTVTSLMFEQQANQQAFSQMHTSMDQMHTSMDDMHTSMGAMQASIVELQTSMGKVQTSISNVKEDVTTLKESSKRQEQLYADLLEILQSFAETSADTRKRVLAIEAKLGMAS